MEGGESEIVKLRNKDSKFSDLISCKFKVTVIGSNGSVEINRIRMALCSPLLRSIFIDDKVNDVLHLPDFSVATLMIASTLMENGEVFGTEDQLSELHKLMDVLDIVKESKFSVDVSNSRPTSDTAEPLPGSRSERKRSATEPLMYNSFRDLKVAKVVAPESPEIIVLSDDDEDYDSENENASPSPEHDAQTDAPQEIQPASTRLVLYRCSACEMTLCNKRKMATHRRTHYKENALCKFCGIKFVTVLEKLDHACVPTEIVQMFSCALCEKKFGEESVMLVHAQQHFGEQNGQNLECPKSTCSKNCTSVLRLLKHVRRHFDELSFEGNETFFPFKDRSPSNKENSATVLPSDSTPLPNPVPETILPVLDKTTNQLLQNDMGSPTDELCCSVCTEVFVTGQDKLDHQCSIEGYNGDFMCNVCFKTFTEKHVMLVHHQQHNELDKLKCPICNKKIPPVVHLLRHVKKHLEENSADVQKSNQQFNVSTASPFKYPCKLCDSQFNSETDFVIHLQTHRNKPSTECPFCNRQFADHQMIVEHIGIHIGQTSIIEADRLCGICNSVFQNDDDFLFHRKKHNVPFPCPICPKVYDSIHELLAHVEGYKEEFERLSYCKYCSLKFNTLGEVIIHSAKHAGKSMLICPVCSMKHLGGEETVQHINHHFLRDDIKCDKCNMEFLYTVDLREHEKSCNVNDSISRITKAFSKNSQSVKFHSCLDCNKNFCSAAKLCLHTQIHKNKSELLCPFCNFLFPNTAEAIKHVEFELFLKNKTNITPGSLRVQN